MLQDPTIVKAPNIDHMERLAASTSSGSSDGTAQGASRPRSSQMNQDGMPAAPQQAVKCPRCDSINTKFCYYNNYSQTQPRHFCKSCRRYWTQGGALRNVPVGGGCRKNKRVKQRPLLNMGGVAGLLDPSSLIDDSTSNMLARLTSNSNFPNFGSGTTNFSDDTSTQLLNIAFSRFQESMRLRQQQQSSDQSPEAAPFFDMSFPGLVHKPCGPPSCTCGTCGSRASLHHGTCGGLMNAYESNLGFTSLPMKMEHDAGMGGFCSGNYELNSLYHEQNPSMHMVGTSATATLASIEDQLSNFSNLSNVDSFNADTSAAPEQKNSSLDSAKRMVSAPLQLLGSHGGSHHSNVENAASANSTMTELPHDTKERLFMDEKPLVNNPNNELSLMMPTDNWQQPSFMNEMLFDTHHNIWNSHGGRWQDMHALAATSTATAGGVL
eukprot:c22941_g1_i1 orf=133-1443(-)